MAKWMTPFLNRLINWTLMNLSDTKTSFQLLFDTGLITKNFNGGILVAKGGNILYENIWVLPIQTVKKIPLKNTSFHLASTSKPFTGSNCT